MFSIILMTFNVGDNQTPLEKFHVLSRTFKLISVEQEQTIKWKIANSKTHIDPEEKFFLIDQPPVSIIAWLNFHDLFLTVKKLNFKFGHPQKESPSYGTLLQAFSTFSELGYHP